MSANDLIGRERARGELYTTIISIVNNWQNKARQPLNTHTHTQQQQQQGLRHENLSTNHIVATVQQEDILPWLLRETTTLVTVVVVVVVGDVDAPALVCRNVAAALAVVDGVGTVVVAAVVDEDDDVDDEDAVGDEWVIGVADGELAAIAAADCGVVVSSPCHTRRHPLSTDAVPGSGVDRCGGPAHGERTLAVDALPPQQ